MEDDPKWEIAFWVVAALVVGLFVWGYSHATSGTEDFADSPPSLAPSAACNRHTVYIHSHWFVP